MWYTSISREPPETAFELCYFDMECAHACTCTCMCMYMYMYVHVLIHCTCIARSLPLTSLLQDGLLLS